MKLNDGLDNRTQDLLNILGMKNRITTIEDDWEVIPQIDYEEVNRAVESLRLSSMKFLSDNMNEL